MICPNCGSKNSDDATSCAYCGQRFGPRPNQTNSQQQENTSNNDNPYGQYQYGGPYNNPYQNDQNQQNQQNWQQPYGNGYQNQNNGYYSNNNYYQQGGPYDPYQNQGPAPYNGLAIASLVIGIVSIVPCCLFPYLCIPLNIVGLILGIISRRKPYGRGMGLAGTIVNIAFLVLSIIWLIIVLYVYTNMPADLTYELYHEMF